MATDTGTPTLREAILAAAARLGCAPAVQDLPDVEAVRSVQQREGNAPCYARKPYGCAHTYDGNCLWRTWCVPAWDHAYGRRVEVLTEVARSEGRASLSLLVAQRAFELGCYGEIGDLSPADAVRRLQREEGSTPCFGGELPWRASPEAPEACAEVACAWRASCDLQRARDVVPLERVVPRARAGELKRLRALVLDRAKEPSFQLPPRSVGLKLRSLASLEASSRKMLLAAPRTVVAEVHAPESPLRRFLVRCGSRSQYAGGRSSVEWFDWEVIETADLSALLGWLDAAAPFVAGGAIDYWPRLARLSTSASLGVSELTPGSEFGRRSIPIPKSWDPATFDAPHLATPDGEIALSEPGFAPLFQIDIPVLEEVSFDRLHAIMRDHPAELGAFREHLRDQLDEAGAAAVGSERFARNCRRIERNLHDRLQLLSADLKRARLKAAITSAGCAVAAWTLAVYCIVQEHGEVLRVLGPGGLVYTLSQTYAEYLLRRMELRERPVQFLWRIGQSRSP